MLSDGSMSGSIMGHTERVANATCGLLYNDFLSSDYVPWREGTKMNAPGCKDFTV